MEIRPITIKEANAFVKDFHRHHKPVVGCKFSLGAFDEGGCLGVAICGRPISRHLDNGVTLEVNRMCTRGGQMSVHSFMVPAAG